MAEIPGLGLTHSPSFIRPDANSESSLQRTLRTNDRIPAELKPAARAGAGTRHPEHPALPGQHL